MLPLDMFALPADDNRQFSLVDHFPADAREHDRLAVTGQGCRHFVEQYGVSGSVRVASLTKGRIIEAHADDLAGPSHGRKQDDISPAVADPCRSQRAAGLQLSLRRGDACPGCTQGRFAAAKHGEHVPKQVTALTP